MNSKQTVEWGEFSVGITLNVGVSELEHSEMEMLFQEEFDKARQAERDGLGAHYPFYVVAPPNLRLRAIDAFPDLRESEQPALIVYDPLARTVSVGIMTKL